MYKLYSTVLHLLRETVYSTVFTVIGDETLFGDKKANSKNTEACIQLASNAKLGNLKVFQAILRYVEPIVEPKKTTDIPALFHC